MNILAWVAIVLVSIQFLFLPLFIGEDRPAYSYRDFVRAGLELAIVVLLSLRVLGII